MTRDDLRSLRDATPFQPFTVHVSGGRSFHIQHRDYLSISPNNRTMIVYKDDGSFSVVDLFLVGELSVDVQPASAAPAGDAA